MIKPKRIADFLNVDATARPEEELAAYIAAPRVPEADALLIARPFSPHLSTRGAIPGPHLLLPPRPPHSRSGGQCMAAAADPLRRAIVLVHVLVLVLLRCR